MKYMMSFPTCIMFPLHAKAMTKIVSPTSTPSYYSRSSSYDCCILPFIDDEAKEEGMEDKQG